MIFTNQNLQESMGLENGARIKIKQLKSKDEACATVKNGKVICDDGRFGCLKDIIGEEFEIVEDKIWDIDEIEEYDGMYCVDIDMDIAALCYEKHPQYFNDIIEKSVAFKKREYAEEYRKELLKFNEEYKKKHRR